MRLTDQQTKKVSFDFDSYRMILRREQKKRRRKLQSSTWNVAASPWVDVSMINERRRQQRYLRINNSVRYYVLAQFVVFNQNNDRARRAAKEDRLNETPFRSHNRQQQSEEKLFPPHFFIWSLAFPIETTLFQAARIFHTKLRFKSSWIITWRNGNEIRELNCRWTRRLQRNFSWG